MFAHAVTEVINKPKMKALLMEDQLKRQALHFTLLHDIRYRSIKTHSLFLS